MPYLVDALLVDFLQMFLYLELNPNQTRLEIGLTARMFLISSMNKQISG